MLVQIALKYSFKSFKRPPWELTATKTWSICVAFHKLQILRNPDVISEQTDEAYSIYATTNVVTAYITLQEAIKSHLSGVPPKKCKLHNQSRMGSSSQSTGR